MEIFGFTTTRPPRATHVASTLVDVRAVVARAEAAAREGRWAALLVTYDAAPAFEPAMQVRPRGGDALPLAWAAEFDDLRPVDDGAGTPADGRWPTFMPAAGESEFCDQVRAVQAHIADGDTYEVNLTFPLHAEAPPDTLAWYRRLRSAQQGAFSAYLDLGRHVVASLSPELFFEISGNVIRTRPMKGTIRRGRWLQEDEALARALATSAKAHAENVMIVDLLRNDVGRVAETGSVRVPSLFAVERYPTLWQLTSTVEGTLRPGTSLPEVFDALFPCGSVTGAPKIRTMEIIQAIEDTPRGLYTGAIGLIRPGGSVVCSVAIRTIVIDRGTGIATLGVGAGITADSVPDDEYAESLLKAAFASGAGRACTAPFQLLETMRLEHGTVVRVERHLRRMQESAGYFGFDWNDDRVRAAVRDAGRAHPHGVWRLRMTVDPDGAPHISCTPHEDGAARVWHIAFANAPVQSSDPFLCNKTTNRAVYDVARRGRPDVDDVLLWNERGEATESTIANLVVEIDGRRWTPPRDCGLLGGTLRGELVETGVLRERVITRGEVMRAERLWLINSVRGWIEAKVIR